MRTIQREIVGAVIISNDGHVLLGKNKQGGVFEGLWVIPGGGIDDGETIEQALRREVLEEVGIDIHNATRTQLPKVSTKATEKVRTAGGEVVCIEMNFYDFRVDIDAPANHVPITLEDDLEYAEWVPFNELAGRAYPPTVKNLLASLGLL